jgi:tetratricopeptide (TPR) repeat protein
MRRVVFSLCAVAAVGFTPRQGTPVDLLRAANAAVRKGDAAAADLLFQHAEERSDDPGLIAFNRATLAFSLGDYRGAELDYLRCLEDRAIPPQRRVQALYNRGVCLVSRGGDAKLLRAAVSCFEQCLDAAPADGQLALDARHNLELAKLLWNEARAKEQTPPTPNEQFDEEPPGTRPQEPNAEELANDPTGTEQRNGNTRTPRPGSQQAKGNPPQTPGSNQQQPGAGTAPVVSDDATPQKLSPEDTTRLLDRAEARLRAARRQNEQLRAGPERPNVRDW